MKIKPYLKLMAQKGASDIFFTTGAPICLKIDGTTRPISKVALESGATKKVAYELLSDQQIREFEETKEMNLGVSIPGGGRYRVNVYYQRGEVSMVIRYIKSDIPSIEKLGLPKVLRDIVMQKNGLVLVVGSTGSGKSTSLASMIEYRNTTISGHILTVEDPIEYTFSHKKSIVGQREVGLDTLSYNNALREAMREAPDVIMIGEVRDRSTMEAAMTYADTGHLCLSTLHAVNANQALDRIINLFPSESKGQILMDLSLNLRGIISQRLVPSTDGGRVPAVEVLMNTPYISELIRKNNFGEIKEVMSKGAAAGMQTFDQCLQGLYKEEKITLEEALNHADSRSNLEWQINFGGNVKSVSQENSADMEAYDNAQKKQAYDTAASANETGDLSETVSATKVEELLSFEDSRVDSSTTLSGITNNTYSEEEDDSECNDEAYLKAAQSIFSED
jgi:twitching motility protein PilU